MNIFETFKNDDVGLSNYRLRDKERRCCIEELQSEAKFLQMMGEAHKAEIFIIAAEVLKAKGTRTK